jgi:AmmeMemoRadiSam system protein B
MNKVLDARPSPIAGQWYPGDALRLAAQVDKYIDAAKLPELKGEVIAVMAPHAGHIYSGPVAGHSFATVRDLSPDIVVVISPMHQPYLEPLLTTAHRAYVTPLGEVPVDHETLKSLDGLVQELLNINITAIANDREHSLEIEIPFLQRALSKPFRLIPLMLRQQSNKVASGLGKATARLLKILHKEKKQSALLVASTDLSHFYTQETARKLDSQILQRVEALDPAGVIKLEEEGKGFACGRGALASVMWAAKELGATHAQVLDYATSGDITGDFSQVVGYGAAVITRPTN